MKVFYWTVPYAEYSRRLFEAVMEDGDFSVNEVSPMSVGPSDIRELIDDGFIEITPDTAYKLGLPT